MNVIKVIVVDDDQRNCNQIIKKIHFADLGLELFGVIHDGQEAYNMIEQYEPMIVIINTDLPKMDGFECIRRVKQKGIKSLFIVISEYRQFDYVYKALKYEVKDYLLQPVDEEELNEVLEEIVANIRLNKGDNLSKEHIEAVQNLFISKNIFELAMNPQSIYEINKLYCTNFNLGIFCIVVFKIDFANKEQKIAENILPLQKKIQVISEMYLSPLCYDVLTETKFTDLIFLLNYSEMQSETIKNKLPEMLDHIKKIGNVSEDIDFTICMGGEHSSVCEIADSREEALNVCWSRRVKGKGNVYYWQDEAPLTDAMEKRLDNLDGKIKKAIKSLNLDEHTQCLNEFFKLPAFVIGSCHGMLFLRNNKDYIFKEYKDLIKKFIDVDNLYYEIRRNCNMANSIEEYKEVYLFHCRWIFCQINNLSSNQNVKQIKSAVAYIERNYNKDIGLNDIAEKIGLTPAYFSYLFKCEIGVNFTVYLTEYRIKHAKKLLEESDMPIKQVSEKVGFFNQQHFSKTFKRIVGIKPTEYRNYYDKTDIHN